jgi:hypothetical protein
VRDKALFRPGLVSWTVSLIVAGDLDQPGGDVASATTMFVGKHGSRGIHEPGRFVRDR